MNEVGVSAPPVFDIEKALLVKETTAMEEGYKKLPSLRTSGNLWLYNNPPYKWPLIINRLERLREKEQKMANPYLPLPTIGWEVEIPRKPFKSSRAGMYALFFDFMGMPRNKNFNFVVPGENPNIYKPSGLSWEFSTIPSYSAAVANRTLSELIKGGFIPHLVGSSTAKDRQELLDDKLVSLHINLGIPSFMVNKLKQISLVSHEDAQLLISSFEFAFTSPERFAGRAQTAIALLKSAETTLKSWGSESYRLELKALEVGNFTTFRLMEEIQLVSAATFIYISEQDSPLIPVWQKTRFELKKVFQKYELSPEMIVKKIEASEKVKNPDIQKELRQILTTASHHARFALKI
jgi:hypothetical protein